MWAHVNPHSTYSHAQHFRQCLAPNNRLLLNMAVSSAGMWNDMTKRPVRKYLQEVLPEFLVDVPTNIQLYMWFQYDEAPPHFWV